MTLIEIIKTSLLGFSTLFVLIWIFFYLFLKFKRSSNQVQEKNIAIPAPVVNLNTKQSVKASPVLVQPVVYPSVYNVQNFNNRIDRKNNLIRNERVSNKARINKPEKYVVFNSRQYGFYNI
jgi:hypothetical protein